MPYFAEILSLVALVFVLKAVFGGGRRHRRDREHTQDLQRQVAELQMARADAPRALAGPSREQVDDLEARVRVLERIVTDRGLNLAAEIEALRDRPAAPSREIERNN